MKRSRTSPPPSRTSSFPMLRADPLARRAAAPALRLSMDDQPEVRHGQVAPPRRAGRRRRDPRLGARLARPPPARYRLVDDGRSGARLPSRRAHPQRRALRWLDLREISRQAQTRSRHRRRCGRDRIPPARRPENRLPASSCQFPALSGGPPSRLRLRATRTTRRYGETAFADMPAQPKLSGRWETGDEVRLRPCGASARQPSHLFMSEGWRRERDSNPRNRFRFSGFQDHRHRPLGHPSAFGNRSRSVYPGDSLSYDECADSRRCPLGGHQRISTPATSGGDETHD